MAYVLKRCRGQKPPTMIPTDCYALRAPTILPNIRISWCLRPTFYAHIGVGHKVILPLVCEHTWCQTFDPGIIKNNVTRQLNNLRKRKKKMGITMILSLLSGVALFLYGMALMGDSLKKVAGNKLELILYKLTNSPDQRIAAGYSCNCNHPVFISNDCHGCRLRQLRYDESCSGDRYYYGSQHRYKYHRMDLMSVLH